MGFFDEEANIIALKNSNGNINYAVEYLFTHPPPTTNINKKEEKNEEKK